MQKMHKEDNNMSFVFAGSYAAFYHECFKMVDTLIQHFEKNTHGLNPHATPYAPRKEVDKVDRKEEDQQNIKELTNLWKVMILNGKVYPIASSRRMRMVMQMQL